MQRLAAALADRYRLERELGAGGMATVYLAQDLKHHRKVAVKVLRPELAAALGPERFLREIETTANLRHPHILPLYDSGEADGFLFYVMPYVDGESLRDRLDREKHLSSEAALQIAREIADALSYAHGHGVVHRDIKPDNILLESGHAVIADFGIARALSVAGAPRLTETGLALGTPVYMSPEQATGDADIDGRSDVYALGAVLYEMLAGQPPFSGATLQAVITAVLTRPPAPLPPSSAPALSRVVMQALAKNPERRFATAAAFNEALRHVETEPPATSSRKLLAGLAVAVVLTGALWFGWGRPAGRAPAPLTTRLVQQTFDEAVEEWPAWSPDGKQFVFSRTANGYRNLFLRQLTGEERQLTRGPRDDIQASWDSAGGRIAFVRSNLQSGKLEPGDVLGWYAEGGDIWTIVRERYRVALRRRRIRPVLVPRREPIGRRCGMGRVAPHLGDRPEWAQSETGD